MRDEAGVVISDQQSTLLYDAQLSHPDETCPMLPPDTLQEHRPLEDPARAEGDDEGILKAFRASRDEIRGRVVDLIERLDAKSEEDQLPCGSLCVLRNCPHGPLG